MKQLTMIDWKSSKGFYPEYFIQLSAYGRAYNREAIRLGNEIVERLGVLRLDKLTGMPEFKDCTDGEPERWAGFCGLLSYYHALIEPNIKEGEKARFYERDGLRGPSVTTVLSCLAKPALIQWAANCSAEFIQENLAEIRDPSTEYERVEQLIKKAKTAHRTVGKKATDTGQLVHDAIETYMLGGKPEPILEGDKKAESAFLAFLNWKDEVKLEKVHLEYEVFHPSLLYGGRVDIIGYLDVQPQIKEETLGSLSCGS